MSCHPRRYSRALPLYERALVIWEATFGATHPIVATSLNILAALYEAQGLETQAAPLRERALAIPKATLPGAESAGFWAGS